MIDASDVELWHLANALDRTAALLAGDVAPALVADIPRSHPFTTRSTSFVPKVKWLHV